MLEHGFAYGTAGTALHGKLFFNALTAGGPAEAYRADGLIFSLSSTAIVLQTLNEKALYSMGWHNCFGFKAGTAGCSPWAWPKRESSASCS